MGFRTNGPSDKWTVGLLGGPQIFNNYFVNFANDIGDPNVVVDTNHPSILQIDQLMVVKEIPALHFKPVDDNFVKKQINRINVKKKATGVDNI
jgi:hypothetical protein